MILRAFTFPFAPATAYVEVPLIVKAFTKTLYWLY
jgi:hypothetical protein